MRSAGELTPKLVEAVEALEEKASQRTAQFFQTLAEKLGRVSRKQIAISAGSGALVALLLVPLLSAVHPAPAPAAGMGSPPFRLDVLCSKIDRPAVPAGLRLR